MRFQCERLVSGGRLDGSDGTGDERLRIVVGGGRGCTLHGEAAAATVLLPLRGRLHWSDGEHHRMLASGDVLIAEAGQRLQAIGRGNALWIAVLVPAALWRRLLGDESGMSDPPLIPALHEADRAVRRAAIGLVRAGRGGDAASVHSAAASFAALLVDMQEAAFDTQIDRCPGRTRSQRRGIFLRLQRVRNVMEASCQLDLDIAGLARMASYSPCHFIRAFSTTYGETPHAVLVEQRLGRARRLIDDSALAITEIARVTGFENRCAFSRSFKRRFGVTASDLRHARARQFAQPLPQGPAKAAASRFSNVSVSP